MASFDNISTLIFEFDVCHTLLLLLRLVCLVFAFSLLYFLTSSSAKGFLLINSTYVNVCGSFHPHPSSETRKKPYHACFELNASWLVRRVKYLWLHQWDVYAVGLSAFLNFSWDTLYTLILSLPPLHPRFASDSTSPA